MILPFEFTLAHARTEPAMYFGLSFTGSMTWLRIWRPPTLFAGRFSAAYEVPPRATKRARYATALARTWRVSRVKPCFLLNSDETTGSCRKVGDAPHLCAFVAEGERLVTHSAHPSVPGPNGAPGPVGPAG